MEGAEEDRRTEEGKPARHAGEFQSSLMTSSYAKGRGVDTHFSSIGKGLSFQKENSVSIKEMGFILQPGPH